MITSTIIENGKTVRTWQESRGSKTLTKVFYLKYGVEAICNGKWFHIAFAPTLEAAEAKMRETMKKVERKYGVSEWHNTSSHEWFSHITSAGCWYASVPKMFFKLYLSVEGGDLISESIDDRPILMASVLPEGQGKRIPWVYAHGKLEDDLKTDLFDVDLNGEVVRDGMKALYHDKVVVFHLYRNAEGQLTGIATYADDEEACAYGRSLVAKKPELF